MNLVKKSFSWTTTIRSTLEEYLLSIFFSLILVIFLFNQRGAAASLAIASVLALVVFVTAKQSNRKRYVQVWLGSFKSPLSLTISALIGLVICSQFWGISEFEHWYRPARSIALLMSGTIVYTVISTHPQKIYPTLALLAFLSFSILNAWLSNYTPADPEFNAASRYYNRIIVSIVLISIVLAGCVAVVSINKKVKLLSILVLVLISGIISFGSYSQTSMLIWTIGWFLCLTLWALPASALKRTVVYVTSLVPLTMPFLIYFGDAVLARLANSNVFIFKNSSSSIRLDIWRTSLELIHQRPFAGWGLDAMQFYPENQTVGGLYQERTPVLFSHPHNAFLQIWLEQGFLGAFLLTVILLIVGFKIFKLREVTQSFAISALVACVLIMSVSHGLWQSWWIGTLIFIFLWCGGFFRKQLS